MYYTGFCSSVLTFHSSYINKYTILIHMSAYSIYTDIFGENFLCVQNTNPNHCNYIKIYTGRCAFLLADKGNNLPLKNTRQILVLSYSMLCKLVIIANHALPFCVLLNL